MSQNIALVDDDQNIIASVSMSLEAEGFNVKTYNDGEEGLKGITTCLLYTSPSPRDRQKSRMPSSA